ncbi:hypothetical protein [Spirillospora sp. NPDC029432]|uniref:hypothetical protein n=1 Tax=Spirillospora sp. NPDC029432 TaxID=3154599 RepID=UPI0034566311
MTDDYDEPLEGDIGPAPAAARPARAVPDAAEELRRYEREREERRRRTNAVAGRIAAVAVALLLGFLAYDSIATAVEARRRGDPWVYPPAVIAGVCLAALAVLALWTVRAGRRGRR